MMVTEMPDAEPPTNDSADIAKTNESGEPEPAVLGVEGKWVGAQKWSYADVQEWLDHLKMGKYRDKFFEWGIDGRILMEMKKEDFELLGIHERKELQKINNSMAKLRACKGDEATYWMPTSHMPKISQNEVDDILDSLGSWVDEIGDVDRTLAAEAKDEHENTPVLPPVRGEGETLKGGQGIRQKDNTPAPRKLTAEEVEAENQRSQQDRNKAGHTHNYFDQWDKFDVEDECAKLDDDESEDEDENGEDEVIEIEGELPAELSKLKGAARQQAAVATPLLDLNVKAFG